MREGELDHRPAIYRAIALVAAVELVWFLSNVYSTHLLKTNWAKPPGFGRLFAATFVVISVAANFFLGLWAINHLRVFVPRPWYLR